MRHLASLLVRLLVQVEPQVSHRRQVVELEVFSPEDGVGARLAGRARVQHVVQAKLAVVALLGGKLARLDDPQLQDVVDPPAVVLRGDGGGGQTGRLRQRPLKMKKLNKIKK